MYKSVMEYITDRMNMTKTKKKMFYIFCWLFYLAQVDDFVFTFNELEASWM